AVEDHVRHGALQHLHHSIVRRLAVCHVLSSQRRQCLLEDRVIEAVVQLSTERGLTSAVRSLHDDDHASILSPSSTRGSATWFTHPATCSTSSCSMPWCRGSATRCSPMRMASSYFCPCSRAQKGCDCNAG